MPPLGIYRRKGHQLNLLICLFQMASLILLSVFLFGTQLGVYGQVVRSAEQSLPVFTGQAGTCTLIRAV